MEQNYIGIEIPEELEQYQKDVGLINHNVTRNDLTTDFGVKLIRDSAGLISQAVYYNDIGDISKRIFYRGQFVYKIEHFRFGKMHSQEMYDNGLIQRKSVYDKNGFLVNSTSFHYNKKQQIVSIRKNINDKKYEITYGYDELERVNCRNIMLNAIVLDNQKYKFDILDRIVEYEDKKQKIKIYKINTNNELIKYSIIDKSGNTIDVYNKFLYSDYIGTEIELNGHKTTIKNKGYLDNHFLKKPYANEDDLDMVLSEIFNVNTIMPVRRSSNTDISDNIININKEKILPISIRKLKLLKEAV